MAEPTDPFSLNVLGVTDLVRNRTNKTDSSSGEDMEGEQGEEVDALDLDMTDEELLKLRTQWELRYSTYETRHKGIVAKNLESYTGKRPNGQWLSGEDNIAANLQFEAEETFLAAALAKNPEPVVWCDNTDDGNQIANSIKTMLAFHSDQLVLRRKLGIMLRQWSIHHLGVLKPGWNARIGDVAIDNRKIQDFVFDPNGYVDADGDFSSYLGERITVSAEKLGELYPKHKEYISLVVEDKLGTDVTYTEWWTDDFCFITFKDVVLDKFKNPYFKYEEPAKGPLGETMMDENGEQTMVRPHNHFAYPKKPYIFLSVFSLQEQPHDITGLIEQNIPNQNLIRKRTEQADLNASSANNAYAFSEDNFTQETAKQAANARKKGNPILIPSGGPIDKAIMPLDGQNISEGILKQLEISKEDLRSSWGVQGIASQAPDEDQTARGMILNQAHDTSRIGGGIGAALEQVADNSFNWLLQLYGVFYDEPHFAAIMGNAKAVEYVTLSSEDLDRQIIVSVAPDSLKPKDDITNMNLAQALFDKGAIGPQTLLKMLDFPNPDEAAADGVLFRLDPASYFKLNFPDYAAKLQQIQQQTAMEEAQQGAQAEGMKTAAVAANTPPEQANGEPPAPTNIASEPASASLSQVPLPPSQQLSTP